MREGRQRLPLLVGRNVGTNKEDAGKLAALARGARERQVPAVDRVESPAKQSNIHAPLVSSFAAPLGKFNLDAVQELVQAAPGGIVRWCTPALSVWRRRSI